MHLPTLALTLLAAVVASEPLAAPALLARQSCGFMSKECGSGCIPVGYTCCPGGEGGCGPVERCVLGSNDRYGCCPIGMTCVGEGGVSTRIGGGIPDPTPTYRGSDDDDDFPTPTEGSLVGDDDDDDDDFPTPTRGSSIGDDDDDDDDLNFSDSSSSTSSSTSSTRLFTPETSANSSPTATAFTPPDDDDDDDFEDFYLGGPSGAGRGALSFVGVLAAALLAF